MEIQKTVQDTEIRAGLESRLPQSHLLHRLLSRPAQEKLRAVSEYLQYREIPPAEKLQVRQSGPPPPADPCSDPRPAPVPRRPQSRTADHRDRRRGPGP